MKSILTKLFWPVLHFFENNAPSANKHQKSHYQKSHRVALIVVGLLFLGLSVGGGLAVRYAEDPGYWLPVAVFFAIGFVCTVVGSLGSEAAVSKIWNSRQ